MENLRLFGVKVSKDYKKVRINDMEFLNNIGTVSIPLNIGERWYDVSIKHLEKCGFKIIGQINIPKYDRAFICEPNPNSLVYLTDELNKGHIGTKIQQTYSM